MIGLDGTGNSSVSALLSSNLTASPYLHLLSATHTMKVLLKYLFEGIWTLEACDEQ